MSKEQADAKEMARQVARTVLAQVDVKEPDETKRKNRLQIIFETCADRAQSGALDHAAFLMKWAYGNPPEEVMLRGAGDDGAIVIDLESAVMRRAQEAAKEKSHGPN